jgi:nucleotide-binding universal stress UspA family protein
LTEMVLGSVSNYVLHHAPCSVLTIQSPIRADSEAPEALTD